MSLPSVPVHSHFGALMKTEDLDKLVMVVSVSGKLIAMDNFNLGNDVDI